MAKQPSKAQYSMLIEMSKGASCVLIFGYGYVQWNLFGVAPAGHSVKINTATGNSCRLQGWIKPSGDEYIIEAQRRRPYALSDDGRAVVHKAMDKATR